MHYAYSMLFFVSFIFYLFFWILCIYLYNLRYRWVGGCYREMGNGRWGMGNGRWEMGGGKWEMRGGKWEMENGRWEMGDGGNRGEGWCVCVLQYC